MSIPTSLIKWAPLANYPVAGKLWDSTPTKVAPAYVSTGFVPGVPPAAYELNWLLAQCAENGKNTILANAINFKPLTPLPAVALGASTANKGPIQIVANDFAGYWVGTVVSATQVGLCTQAFQDATWDANASLSIPNPLGSFTSANAPRTLAVDAAGNTYVDNASTATNVDIWKVGPGGTSPNFASINTTPPTVTGLADVKITILGTTIIAACPGTGGAGKLGVLTANTFTSGVTGITAPCILKNNGTTALAVTKAVAATAYVSTNGTSWSSASLSATIGASGAPSDAAWDPVQQLWLMAVSNPSGSVSFYTSPDGQVWTATGTTLTNSFGPATSVVSFNGLWLAAGPPVAGTPPFVQLIWSWDAVTWRTLGVVSNVSGTPVIAAGACQTMFYVVPSTSTLTSSRNSSTLGAIGFMPT